MAIMSVALLAFVLSAVSDSRATFTVLPFALESPASAISAIPAASYVAEISGKVRHQNPHKKEAKRQLVQHLRGKNFIGGIDGVDDDNVYVTSITIGGQDVSAWYFSLPDSAGL
jgi:hypothetical protein